MIPDEIEPKTYKYKNNNEMEEKKSVANFY